MQMLSSLVEVHGEVVRESFSEGLVKKWLLDANAGGAFPWADPFQVVSILNNRYQQTNNDFEKGQMLLNFWIYRSQDHHQHQVEGMQEVLRSHHLGRVFFAGEYTAKVARSG